MKLRKKLLLGTLATAAVIISPSVVVACDLSITQNSDDDGGRAQFDREKIDKVLSWLTPKSVNGIDKALLANDPTQKPVIASIDGVDFIIAKTVNVEEKTITLEVTGRIDDVFGTSTQRIVLTGFLGVQEKVDNALNKLTAESVTGVNKKLLPDDASQKPAIASIDGVSFTINNKTPDVDKGTLTLKVTGKMGDTPGSKTKEIVIKDFLTTKNVVDKALDKITAKSVEGIDKAKASNDAAQKPTIKPDGKVNFTIKSTSQPDKGTLTLEVTGKIGDIVGTKTKEIVVDGFVTPKSIIDKVLDGLTEKSVEGIDKAKASNDDAQKPEIKPISGVSFTITSKTSDADKGTLTLEVAGNIGKETGSKTKDIIVNGFATPKNIIDKVLDGLTEKSVEGIDKAKASDDVSQKPTIKNIGNVSFTITQTTQPDKGILTLEVTGNIGKETGTKTKEIVIKDFHVRTWSESGSNITNGLSGTVFQSANGNIYAMAGDTALQMSSDNGKTWTDVGNGCAIPKGNSGFVFEAKNGDLYATGEYAPLQILKKDSKTWISAPGSNIVNGANAKIMQAANGDIYSMGNGQPLQILKGGDSKNNWTTVEGSGITDGLGGAILQAKNGDIYAMGNKSKLRVMVSGQTAWADANGCKINGSGYGSLFQAANGDIYAMGNGQPLQVLKGGETKGTTWKDAGNDSIIADGLGGKMFQVANGDIYAMASKSKLNVLKNGQDKWTIANGSNITDGLGGKVLQSANGDIYSFGSGTPLQILKKGTDKWVPQGSEITGYNGTIFQASNGDIYVMGIKTHLQIFK